MSGKPWLDEDSFDEAFEVGSALYRARQLAAQMLRNDEDMPFDRLANIRSIYR